MVHVQQLLYTNENEQTTLHATQIKITNTMLNDRRSKKKNTTNLKILDDAM